MRLGAAATLAALALLGCPASHAPRHAPTAGASSQPARAAPSARPLPVPLEVDAHHHDEPALAGVLHVVAPGETMWRIARAYGIDAADLMETNGIADPRAVAVGTELFVPGAMRVVAVGAAESSAATSTSTSTSTSTPTSTSSPTSTSTSTSTPTASSSGRSSLSPRIPPHPLNGIGEGQGEGGASQRLASAKRAAADDDGAPLAWPLQGVLYGRYGVRAGKRHDGIDIAAPEGTPVKAAGDGEVIYAGEQAGYGAIVILRHAGGLVTLYAHNSRLLVEDGERVRKGQPIARVGQTGRTSGPHLHFEVRQGTRPKNPLLFLP